jgi:hypothetical protein
VALLIDGHGACACSLPRAACGIDRNRDDGADEAGAIDLVGSKTLLVAGNMPLRLCVGNVAGPSPSHGALGGD